MFPFRMAQAPAFYALYALIFLIHTSHAVSQLPRELSNLIPGCAEQCFLSFLDVHFDGSDCSGSSLSLSCVCSNTGATPFTVGEGAVQCISAEKRFGNCSEFAASDTVISAAYRMCDDEPDAIQPTHEVITASLILPSASDGVVKFPPVKTTAPPPEQQPQPTGAPTTLITNTEVPPIIPTVTTRPPLESTTEESSTLVTTTRPPAEDTTTTASPPETSTTEDSPPSPPAETDDAGDDGEDDNTDEDAEDDDDGTGALGAPQIAGISVGVAAAGAVAIMAIILARRCRRQNHPGLRTGFLPRRSTWGPKFNPTQENSTHSWLANQIRAPLDAADILPPPPAYQQRPAVSQHTWRQDGLGVVIQSSPQIPPSEHEAPLAVTQDRRVSKLLPAKPEMSPTPLGYAWRSYQRGEPSQPAELESKPSPPPPQNVPVVHNAASSSQNRSQPPVSLKLKIPEPKDLTKAPAKGAFPRDSSITQFEEDSIFSPEGQIWRPPSSAPLTAIPIYIADKNGNWVLASPSKQWPANPSMTSFPTPTTVGAAITTYGNNATQANPRASDVSQPGNSSQPPLAPAARIVRTSDASSNFRHSVSAYSQSSSVPRPLFYFNPRQSSAPPHHAPPASTAYRPQPPLRNASDESDETVFETSSSGDSKDPTPPEIRNTLTPVIESPPSANTGSFAARRNFTGPDASGRSGLGLDFFSSQNNNGNNTANRYRPGMNQPPPTRPMYYYPPGQPSPTLGTTGAQPPPPAAGSGMSSLNVPQKGRVPMDATRLGGSSQPATMRIVEPSPEPEDMAVRSAGSYASRTSPFNNRPSPSGRPGPVHPQQFGLPARPNILPVRPGPQPQQQQQRQPDPPRGQQPNRLPPFQYGLPPGPRPQPYPTPYHPPQRRPQQPQQQQQQQQQVAPPVPPSLNTQIPLIGRSPADFQSPASERTVSSTASSLLAKRLGNDRAVQMAMPIDPASSVQQYQQQQQQQQQRWQRGNYLSPEPTTPKMPNDLPSTPTWVPKLTPTRRGDDLFLNVQ